MITVPGRVLVMLGYLLTRGVRTDQKTDQGGLSDEHVLAAA